MDDILVVVACALPLAIHLLRTRGAGTAIGRHAAIGLGLAFCYFALGHFVITDELAAMLPGWAPARRAIIHVTGLVEIVIAASLLTARTRRAGALAAATMLVAVFPANVYAALNHVGAGPVGLDGSVTVPGPEYLWVRAPLQLFLVIWALWPCRLRDAPRGASNVRN